MGLPILILTVTVGVSWSTFRAFETQQASSILIDIAGRQRMLSQRLYLEMLAGLDHQTTPPEALRYLTESALALRYGGKIINPRLADQWEHIQKAPNLRIASKLDEQLAVIESVHRLLKTKFKTDEAMSMIHNISLLADNTVQLYVEESQMGMFRILVQNIAFIIVLATLGLGFNRLIVDRKYQLKELAKAKEAALHASDAKSMFLANMSHEIRTPLNAIIGMAELLESANLNFEQKRFVETLKRASDTLLNLINDILDLSRVESGQIDLDLSSFELNELLDQVSQIISIRAHQKNLELSTYIDPSIPPIIIGDRNRLVQILMNLLSNAVKFTRVGEISLKIEPDPESLTLSKNKTVRLRFSVSDTGIGIAEEKLQAIFENFVQADSSVSFNYGGTGLGLAISKKLVELMGGKIGVTSNLGKGSTFYFLIDAKLPENITMQDQIATNFDFSKYEILIVDDNETNRFIIKKYLENSGAQLDEAASGEEAIQKVRNAKNVGRNYDVILLDYRMPEKNGFEVASQINNEHPTNSTIISLLTSDGNSAETEKLPELGITNYLIKPIKRKDLFHLIHRSLNAQPQLDAPHIDPTQNINLKQNKKIKILVVDDVEDNRFVVTSYLNRHQFEIVEACDGEQAVKLALANQFDLILMDMRMTPMDGYETTREIRKWEQKNQLSSRSNIIALTAHALKDEIEKAKVAGCDHHLTKPITRLKLYETLEQILKVKLILPQTEEIKSANSVSHLTIENTKTAPIPESLSDDELIYIEPERFLKPRLAQYLENRRNDLNTIEELLKNNDYENIITIGHNVAGTAGTYGMLGLTDLSRKIEHAAMQANTEEIYELLKQVRVYLTKVRVK